MRVDVFGTPNCTATSPYRDQFPCISLNKAMKWTKSQLVVASCYTILVTFGLPLNIYVIWMIITIIRAKKDVLSRHMHMYILAMSSMDTTVLLTVTAIISDIFLFEYVLGSVICKVQFAADMAHKILISFILTALSWDRFIAIKSPTSGYKYRSVALAKILLAISITITLISILPILIYANIVRSTYAIYPKESGIEANVTATKCGFNPPRWLGAAYPKYCFVLGYAIPTIAITTFYTRALCTIRKHVQGRSVTTISLGRVTISVIAVIAFYYICWTPYWAYEVLLLYIMDMEVMSSKFTNISVGIHCLPYVNSAINPIMYALLNRELRRTYDSTMVTRRASRHADIRTGIGHRSDAPRSALPLLDHIDYGRRRLSATSQCILEKFHLDGADHEHGKNKTASAKNKPHTSYPSILSSMFRRTKEPVVTIVIEDARSQDSIPNN